MVKPLDTAGELPDAYEKAPTPNLDIRIACDEDIVVIVQGYRNN